MNRALRRLLAVLAVVGTSATGASGQDRPELADLRFPGATSFSRAELLAAIVSTPTRCPGLLYRTVCWTGLALERGYLDPRIVEADALRLRIYYYDRGYRSASVEPRIVEIGPDRARVEFRIREGEPVRVAELDVAGATPDADLGELPLSVGDPFDVVSYEAGRDTLLNRLRNQGYAHAQVLLSYGIRADSPLRASIRYDIYPGPRSRIGEIEVAGTDEVSPLLVRRLLSFEEGDPYSWQELLESQRNLYRLQIFRHADVQADLSESQDSIIPIRVQVAEGDLRRVRVGGGFTNVECVNVEGRWVNRNFMGGGRRVEARVRVGNLLFDDVCQQLPGEFGFDGTYGDITGLASLDFTQPWFFGPRNNVSVGLFTERRSVPDVFVRSAVGGYLTLGRTLGRSSALTLGYRPELTELITEGDLFFCVNFVACAFDEIDVLQAPHWLSPLTLAYTLDRSDAIFAPSSGFIVRADLEHADRYTASDFAYTRLQAEVSGYTGKPGGVILATRLRGGRGWHRGDEETGLLGLNPQKRFFGGGSNSLRGVAQYRLGPKVLSVNATGYLLPESDPADPNARKGAGCTMTSVNDGSCDASAIVNHAAAFDARPVGGDVLLEGNVELRFPLPVGGGKLRGAAFVDVGQVWAAATDVELSDIVATPGFGFRYYSPVGPIRIDFGYNPQSVEELRVLTTSVETCDRGSTGCTRFDHLRTDGGGLFRNTDSIVALSDPVTYDPYNDFFDRWQLHFSIGQAF